MWGWQGAHVGSLPPGGLGASWPQAAPALSLLCLSVLPWSPSRESWWHFVSLWRKYLESASCESFKESEIAVK